MDITELLAFSQKQGASDLHLSAGLPPMIRVDGDIRRINVPSLDSKEVYAIGHELPPNGSVPLEGVEMKIGQYAIYTWFAPWCLVHIHLDLPIRLQLLTYQLI